MVYFGLLGRVVAVLILTPVFVSTYFAVAIAGPSGLRPPAGLYGARASLNTGEDEPRFHPELAAQQPTSDTDEDYRIRFAFGKTFGTSTELDYVTVEVSRRVTQSPAFMLNGHALGELQLAFLASHVHYKAGVIERVKKLAFQDGYELGFIPKAHLTLPHGPMGIVPYLESGAGIGYVSETYRNSGSRWNWSLLGGMGMERRLHNLLVLNLGIQWRHLSNGNMWGKGDELHNSNSGTDMIQGLATLVHWF